VAHVIRLVNRHFTARVRWRRSIVIFHATGPAETRGDRGLVELALSMYWGSRCKKPKTSLLMLSPYMTKTGHGPF